MFYFLCMVAVCVYVRIKWKDVKKAVFQWRFDKINRAEEELTLIQKRMLELYERGDEADRSKIEKYHDMRRRLEYRIEHMKRDLEEGR